MVCHFGPLPCPFPYCLYQTLHGAPFLLRQFPGNSPSPALPGREDFHPEKTAPPAPAAKGKILHLDASNLERYTK